MGTVFVVLVVAVVVLMLIGSVALTRRPFRKRQERIEAKASQGYPLVFLPGKVPKMAQGVRLTVGLGGVESEAEIRPPPPAYSS